MKNIKIYAKKYMQVREKKLEQTTLGKRKGQREREKGRGKKVKRRDQTDANTLEQEKYEHDMNSWCCDSV